MASPVHVRDQAECAWITRVLVGAALGVLLTAPFTSAFFSGVVAAIAASAAIGMSVAGAIMMRDLTPAALAKVLARPLVGVFVVVFGIKVLHDTYFLDVSLGERAVLQHLAWSGLYLVAGLLILTVTRGRGSAVMPILAIGFIIFMTLNLVGYRAGLATNVTTGNAARALESSGLEERMVAPFGPGLNNFGSLAAVGAQCCLLATWMAWRARRWVLGLLFIGGVVLAIYLLFLVQIRSGLLGLVLTATFILVAPRWKRGLATVAFVGMIVLPVLFIHAWGVGLMEKLVPDQLVASFARNEDELFILGGRAYVYEYGWDQLFGGEVGWLGQGMVERDSGPVASEFVTSVEGSSFSFHNGVLELLIVYGPVLGGLILALLVVAAIGWYRTALAGDIGLLGVITAVYAACYLEAFTSAWSFWLLILVALPVARASGPPGEEAAADRI